MSSYAVTDTMTMMRRDFKHTLRFPMMLASSILTPTFLLLMFVGIFGGAMNGALAGTGVTHYVDYITPAIIIQTVGFNAQTTAVTVNQDVTEGVIARFRTMAIWRSALMAGTVLGSILRTLVTCAALFGVAFAVGFRPAASAAGWAGVFGLILALSVALMWLSTAFGLKAKTVAGANSMAVLVAFLPFISGAFVPTGSMPGAVKWIAENQPFNPVIKALRGCLYGTPIGNAGWLALAWCAGMAIIGFAWSRALYNRDPAK